MKKLVLTVALVALLVAAVIGGQALASSKPADVTVSEETSAILGSSYWGYPVRMKTLSGIVEASGIETLLEETYPGIRHVSLTIAWGVKDDPSDRVLIYTDAHDWTYIPLELIQQPGVYTYEFDVDNWELYAENFGSETIEIYYWATITYPSNQW